MAPTDFFGSDVLEAAKAYGKYLSGQLTQNLEGTFQCSNEAQAVTASLATTMMN